MELDLNFAAASSLTLEPLKKIIAPHTENIEPVGAVMSKPDVKRPRCSYFDALAAIGIMKGVPMIDVARDDALVGALMEMDLRSIHRIVERYDRSTLGYPTPETVAQVAAACELVSPTPAPPPEPASEPQPCPGAEATPLPFVQVHTISGRVGGVVWAVLAGVASTLSVGWITAAPWLDRIMDWLIGLLAS